MTLINVYPTSAPQAAATTDLIDHLRTDDHPGWSVAGTGVTVYVGGNTAIFVDFARVLSSKLPLFIGLVVVLSFLLLAMVFRSLVIPLTAAAMNLLSIGAAFGVLVAVFQWGWLGSVFRVSRPGPDRGVPAGDAVRHPLRPVHGLRGLPRSPGSTRSGSSRATTARRCATAWPPPARPSPPPP